MSTQPTTRGVTALLLFAVGLILACGVVTTAPTSAPLAADATKASLQLQSTAMALHLTQAALASQLQQPAATLPPQATSAPTETQPVYTATVTPVIRLQVDAIEISYGDKLGSYPRKSAGTLWGFKGMKGDIVTIVLTSSNARPGEPVCNGATASTTFTLQTPRSQLQATYESPHLSSVRDYELPASGAYYVLATCSGSGCNGHCTEADLSLEKK
jgi:hypothetical protein